ncbi:unnamed protein product [Musa hybrid cultivar]
MAEARRHSVDIPLSRTLVALRRVRSLRDPDTSSLSKIAALVDNMNLEASSCGSSATFGSSNNKHDLRHKGSYHWERRRMVDLGIDSESDNNCLAPDSYIAKSGLAKRSANDTRVQESCGGHMNRSYDSKCVHRCTSQLEKELDSQHGREFEQFEMIGFSSLKQTRYDALRRSYTSKGDVFMRNPGIPWACANETCTSALGHKLLGPATKNVDHVLPNNNGCQVSCCWSRVPKFHDLKLPSDVEGQEFQLNSQINKELDHHVSASYHDSLMNLSEKYRPKSFHELVGQSEVAQSLLDTILKGKIAPIYLFHGPRGIGKTSAARIFAAALNCQFCKEQWPCGCCQECVLVFSGRSRDVTELDASETNHKDALKVLSESALVPTSSCYKIFIIDECQLLQRNIWSAIYKSIKDLSRQVVFIMITSDPDKLPSGTLSWCQRYHFLNVKSDDIVGRLKKICLEEKLEFEEDALIFLATESNGSLRDAITTLDQLALLGKGIITSLAYELMGIISNDELLDLLHLALSSDTSGTVRRARELISSGIDPMQLTSQLAKLIMDILSGGCQLEPSRFIAEADKENLKHGLKILVETEKQLRTSKDQSTWLTAALLQFNTGESLPPTNMNPLEAPEKVSYSRDDGPPTVASPKESLKSAIHVCNHHISSSESHYDAARELEDIWRRTIENCQSSSLKRFLWKEGRLSSVHVCEGLAIAELEFCHPDHVSRAEKSWELIIGSLQTVLGCKVDIKISLVPINRTAKKKSSISLFCCTGRKQQTSDLTVANKKDSLLPGTKEETIEFSCKSDEYFIERSCCECATTVHDKMLRSDCEVETILLPLTFFLVFLAFQKFRKAGYSFLANPRTSFSTTNPGFSSANGLPFSCRLFPQNKVFHGWNNLFMLYKTEENISKNNPLRKFFVISARSSMTHRIQVAWKQLCVMYSYRGIASSPVSKIACAASLAVARSHLVPSFLAFITGEIALSKTAWADGEYFPTRNALYMQAQDSHIFLTSFILSILECFILFLRAFYLAVLFSPIIVLAPLADSCDTQFRKMWNHLVHSTLEKAGPAFIKWGQWAATRPDLFPSDLCYELAKLHCKAPAHSFAYTRKSIERAFGRKLSDVFENFEEEPVASGSVAQVHRASLRFRHPGQHAKQLVVAVKVRHPGVGESIKRDFMIINMVAKISKFMPTLKWLRLDESVQQFAVFMMSQVDLAREAAHLSRFIYNFRRWKDVSFPKPLYPLVHPAVLVETYEHGQSVSYYVDELEGHDRLKSALAHIGTHALLKMLLVDNFVHADLHPGNMLVRAQTSHSNKRLFKSKPHVIFLDVGMTAELSSSDRVNLLNFFKAVALRDGRTAAECTLRLSRNQNCSNPKAFIEEVDKSFSFWGSPEGDSVHPAECMHQLLEQVRRHKVNIDGNVCTVMVTTLVLEGWQRKLDPDYDIMQTLQTLLFKSEWAQSLSYTIEALMSP